MQTATYFQAQQPQQQAQDAQGPAAAVENYVTQALGQLQAQQGLPVTQMGEQTAPRFNVHLPGCQVQVLELFAAIS